MIYLASPYSHPDAAVRERRYRLACAAVAALARAGRSAFSPVVHSHPLVALGLPTDWAFWRHLDRAFLARCDEVVVLTLEGWEQSVGVREEVRIAGELGKPVRYVGVEEAASSPTAARAAGEVHLDPSPGQRDEAPRGASWAAGGPAARYAPSRRPGS